MQLILRGKRLGFSLTDIAEFLDLYDADPQHLEQMRALAERVRLRIEELEQQRDALDQTLGELAKLEGEALAKVYAGDGTATEDELAQRQVDAATEVLQRQENHDRAVSMATTRKPLNN